MKRWLVLQALTQPEVNLNASCVHPASTVLLQLQTVKLYVQMALYLSAVPLHVRRVLRTMNVLLDLLYLYVLLTSTQWWELEYVYHALMDRIVSILMW